MRPGGANSAVGVLFCSVEGPKFEPVSLVENDLIAQNLLVFAYEKPMSISELSRAIGIPAAYLGPIVKKLTDGELMVRTDGGKPYADFIITRPQDALKSFQPQLDFAHRHFDVAWSVLTKMSDENAKLDCVCGMSENAKIMLDRYAVLKALQDFIFFATDKVKKPNFPMRRDGGRWCAQGVAIDAGYDLTEYEKSQNYAIQGGHRVTEAVSVGRTKRIRLHEFGTTLRDAPQRYGGAMELYFKYIIPLLWDVYDGISLAGSEIPNEFISYMKTLEQVGMIGYSEDKPFVKIPVITQNDYERISEKISAAAEQLKAEIGAEAERFIDSMKTPIPKHLTSVPELFRYHNATEYFVMAIVREAYERGLHLKGVDACCPPAVLVYEP